MKYVIVLLLNSIFFFSCVSLKSISHNPKRIILSNSNSEILNGKYLIIGLGEYTGYLNSYLLTNRNPFQKTFPDSNDFVQLKLIDKNKMKISVFQNGKKIQEEIVKGKIEENYFQFKPRFNIHLFTLILNAYNTNDTRISILKNGNLTLDSEQTSCGFLLIMPLVGSEGKKYNLEFQRIE